MKFGFEMVYPKQWFEESRDFESQGTISHLLTLPILAVTHVNYPYEA